jgi:hypothetical protein
MLDAVAFEDADFAGIHADGDRDGDEALGEFGALAEGVGHVDEVGDGVELVAGHLVDGVGEEMLHGKNLDMKDMRKAGNFFREDLQD